ncbi:MAG: hypothetical protein ACM3MG_09050 [Bacillota bacterium]
MKKFLVIALLMASTAHAGDIKELSALATADVEDTLDLLDLDYRYKIVSQDFGEKTEGSDIAVQTIVKVQNLITGQTKEWTCVTQFVKTPKFFDIFSTICN